MIIICGGREEGEREVSGETGLGFGMIINPSVY